MASDERLGRTMLFPLAERMVIKFINEDKIEAEAGNVSEQQGVSFIICDVPINETAYCFYNNYCCEDIAKVTIKEIYA